MLYSLIWVLLCLIASMVVTPFLADFVFARICPADFANSEESLSEKYQRAKYRVLQQEITGLLVQPVTIDIIVGATLARLRNPILFITMIAVFALIRLAFYLWITVDFAKKGLNRIIGASVKCGQICLAIAFLLNVPWGQPMTF